MFKIFGDKFLQIAVNQKTIITGFLWSVVGAFLTGVYTAVTAVPPHFPVGDEWKTMAMGAVAAGITYLFKNLLTNSEGKIGREPKPPVD